MSSPEWTPAPSVTALFETALAGNKWAGTNAPTAGPRTEKALPSGNAKFQLYSLATPVRYAFFVKRIVMISHSLNFAHLIQNDLERTKG